MAEYVLPVPGDFYVFPAWQPHSVAPFRGEGERWSIAFNVVAVPQAARPSAPAAQPAAAQSAPAQSSVGPPVAGQPAVNVSLSTVRPRPGGF